MGELGAFLLSIRMIDNRSCLCNRIMARKIFNTVYEIVSTAVVTIGVILAVIYLCGIRLYHVKSGSMGELLPVGSVCFVSTYSSYEKIEAGDIISFRVSDDMLVTHRAIRITAEGIRTKGDENNAEDPDAVTKENYIGKTVFALPHIGEMFSFLHTTAGKVTIVSSLLVLLVMGRIYNRKDAEEKI